LPNYIDDLTSEETGRAVGAHLDECAECRRIYEQMRVPIDIVMPPARRGEINFLKKVRIKMLRNALLGIAALLAAAGVLTWVFMAGSPSDTKDVMWATRVADSPVLSLMVAKDEEVGDSTEYLDNLWGIIFTLRDGKKLDIRSEDIFSKDDSGEKIKTGIILKPYVTPAVKVGESAERTSTFIIGDYFGKDELIPGLTVVIRFKNRDVVYTVTRDGALALAGQSERR
jgi:hypothetical protein